MSKNTIIITQKPGEAAAVEASVPVLRDDYILVKVKAVALNPTDWKHVAWLTSEGARVSDLSSTNCSFGELQCRYYELKLRLEHDWQ